MRSWSPCLLVALLMPCAAEAIEFDRYHDQAEVAAYLDEVVREHGDFVRKESLGASEQGRALEYLVLTKAPDPAAAPAIYLNGTHHGDEWSSTESVLGVIARLTAAGDPRVAAILSRFVVVAQPIVNADGHARGTRHDAAGRDPNRDYAFPDRDDAESFRIASIRKVKGLVDQYRFAGALAYHSGIEEVLWPWCYTGTAAADNNLLHTLTKRTAEAMGFDRYMASYFDYPTEGEFIDYAYSRHETMALTVEVSADKTPAARELPRIVARAVDGTLAFAEALAQKLDGTLVIEPAPFYALTPQAAHPLVAFGQKLE